MGVWRWYRRQTRRNQVVMAGLGAMVIIFVVTAASGGSKKKTETVAVIPEVSAAPVQLNIPTAETARPTIQPTTQPTNGAAATPRAAAATTSAATLPRASAIPQTPAYEVVSSEKTSTPNRLRYRAEVVVPQEYGRDQTLLVLADAARKVLRDNSGAKAVVIFAYGVGDARQQFTKGRAWASSDGNGWTGDGSFDTGKDNNMIHMTIGASGIASLEQVQVKR